MELHWAPVCVVMQFSLITSQRKNILFFIPFWRVTIGLCYIQLKNAAMPHIAVHSRSVDCELKADLQTFYALRKNSNQTRHLSSWVNFSHFDLNSFIWTGNCSGLMLTSPSLPLLHQTSFPSTSPPSHSFYSASTLSADPKCPCPQVAVKWQSPWQDCRAELSSSSFLRRSGAK